VRGLGGGPVHAAPRLGQEAVGQLLVEVHGQGRHVLHQPRHAAHLAQDRQDVVTEPHLRTSQAVTKRLQLSQYTSGQHCPGFAVHLDRCHKQPYENITARRSHLSTQAYAARDCPAGAPPPWGGGEYVVVVLLLLQNAIGRPRDTHKSIASHFLLLPFPFQCTSCMHEAILPLSHSMMALAPLKRATKPREKSARNGRSASYLSGA